MHYQNKKFLLPQSLLYKINENTHISDEGACIELQSALT
jgi:hypothetical protein